MQKLVTCALAATLLAVGLAGCGRQAGTANSTETITGDPTRVVAKVGNEPVTLREVNRIVQAWRTGGFPEVNPSDPEGTLQRKAIDNLVDQKILIASAREAGVTADPASIDASIQGLKGRFPTEEAFREALTQQGVDEAELRQGYTTDMLIRGFIEKAFLDTVQVTPEQAKRFYEANPQQFSHPDLAHVRHILAQVAPDAPPEAAQAARARLELLLRRARGGEDFAKLATESSEDPGSAPRGGDLSFIARGRMPAAFDSAAFALKPGEIAGPVRTQFGWHLIRLEETRPAGLIEFDMVASRLLQQLRQERADQHVKAYLETKKKKTKVKFVA